MYGTTNIRLGQKKDASIVAPLIVQAMGDLAGDFVGSEQIEDAIPLFESLFVKTENQYSHDHTLVFEEENEVLGSITAYDGGKLMAYRQKMLTFIAEEYEVTDLHLEAETQAGELYIDTLSVSPKAQGKGVGTSLLKAILQKAKAEQHTHVGLLVDKENPHAKRLYSRLGFEVAGEVTLLETEYEHMQLSL